MEFERKNFTGFTAWQILAEIQNMMTEIQCEREQFSGRITSMSMFNDIVWREKGNEELCIANSPNRSGMYKKIRARTLGHFLGLDQRRNGTELIRTNHMENGIESQNT